VLLWVNWKTKITHLSEDCHQLGRLIEEPGRVLEIQEGTAEELTSVPRRYCGWCVSRMIRSIEGVPFTFEAETRENAMRADYMSPTEAYRAKARATIH